MSDIEHGEGGPVDEPIRKLVHRFWPMRGVLRSLSARQGVDVYISVTVELGPGREYMFPEFHLDSALVAQLGELGAGIDRDVYR